MNAVEKYNARADRVDSLLCVGLDSDEHQLPDRFRRVYQPQYAFNRWIIEQTHPYAAAYKINTAFYEARGEQGWLELRLTVEYLREHHPDILIICDAKRGDIGSTNRAYAVAVFDELGFDAVTLHPYTGAEAMRPFLERADKGCIFLCRTSNAGAGEIQDLLVHGQPLWMVLAERISRVWNEHGNCMLVMGATYPSEIARVRRIVGEMTLLVPGVGAQGGDLEATVQAGVNGASKGLILNISRGVIFTDDPAAEAARLREAINRARRPS